MRPVQHPSNNDVLGAPKGATPDQCSALPITRIRYQPSGVPAIVSYWQPTAEQLQLLNQGKPIWLSLWGSTMPPASIGVDGDGRLS